MKLVRVSVWGVYLVVGLMSVIPLIEASGSRDRGENDWASILVSVKNTGKSGGHYSVELKKLAQAETSFPRAKGKPILLIPGFTQNAWVFDLLPERGVSFARYLRDQYGMSVYVLHSRGLGRSGRPPRSNLDDLAIDDVPAALDEIAQREGQLPIVLGHSQGGIVLQASLSGLARCGRVNCFRQSIAEDRNRKLATAIVVGSNSDMTSTERVSSLTQMADLGAGTLPLMTKMFDYIPVGKIMRRLPLPRSAILNHGAWKVLFQPENVGSEARRAVLEKTIEATSVGIIRQYVEGIRKGGIRNSAGEKYTDHLKWVQVPFYQIAFEWDQFANPRLTYDENFSRIGSMKKTFFEMEGQGHEDFLLNGELHFRFDVVFSQ